MPWWWVPFAREFERRADEAVKGLPLRMTSWGRTRVRNAAVGGASASQHLVWTAADFAGSAAAQRELVQRALSVGLVAIDEGDHVHLQLFRAGVVPTQIYDAVAK